MGSITLKQVVKRFDATVVIPPLDLTIEDGEFVVFVGPSGCGKSTLLRLIAGLEDVTEGVIEIDGVNATDLPPAKRGLAMVFQSYALYPHMSVRKNIAFPLKMAGMDQAAIDAKVNYAASTLNLADYIDRRPGQLSGGQRQRVAIGRAIVREPSAFLFDEPLSNLDAALRGNMRLEITELHQTLATTMVYVTHDQVEAMTMADKIAVLRAGVVEQFGAPLELYHSPVNRFVAGFIGSPKMNFLKARVVSAANGEVSLDAGRSMAMQADSFNLRDDIEVVAGIRPNAVRIAEAGAADVTVEVHGVERLGGESYLYTKTRDGSSVTVNIQGETSLEIGQEVGLSVDVDKVHLFDTDTGVTLHK